ncbi:MAG: hypothetical protein RLZZ184_2617 [Cyanobacteriota bacterium]|jgi:hypothetical protein
MFVLMLPLIFLYVIYLCDSLGCGMWDITFPVIFKVFKPQGTLKEGEKYQTKIELASEIITELIDEGFNIELVLADSLYGESSQFIKKLNEYNKVIPLIFLNINNGIIKMDGKMLSIICASLSNHSYYFGQFIPG